jgi:hypothetical protein
MDNAFTVIRYKRCFIESRTKITYFFPFQAWEFRHPNFKYNRQDLLEEIKVQRIDAKKCNKDTYDLYKSILL